MIDNTGINGGMSITVNEEAKHVTAGASNIAKLNTGTPNGQKPASENNISNEYTDELRKQLGNNNG